jgi:hypothetical protein
MKFTIIIVSIVIVLFIGVQIFALRGQRNIETYSYKIEKEYDNFEIRTYESTLFTTVKLANSNYENASSEGFSILAGYIFGGNDKGEKISMTSPVTMTLEDSMTMMFMVPKGIKEENLPVPNESKIKIKKESEKTVAAMKFSGWANDEKIERYKQSLITALATKGISHNNRFYFYGYNAPYEIFNRRNEIVVELSNY